MATYGLPHTLRSLVHKAHKDAIEEEQMPVQQGKILSEQEKDLLIAKRPDLEKPEPAKRKPKPKTRLTPG